MPRKKTQDAIDELERKAEEKMAEDEGVADDPELTKIKKRFKVAVEAWEKQAAREKDDLAFQAPDKQWDEGAKRQRLGLAVEGVPTPARPVLSISKLDQPIQMVLNQERSAHLGVSIQPLSPDAEEKTADILEGIYRRIERDSPAHLARSWGFTRAVKAGRGYYEIVTEYDEYSDNPQDQCIKIKRILHQESVYFDPAAQEPDFSDANYAFKASWVPLEDFKAEFPDAKVPKEADGFDDNDVADPLWVKGDSDNMAVRVALYYDRKKTYKRVKEGERKRETCEVTWYLVTGAEVIDSGPWNGHYIPFVTVVGTELIPFDDERRWQGLIGPAKDAQRMYNYAASSAIELAALEPKAPWVGVEGQFEGHESEWQQANIRNFAYLEYKQTDSGGRPAPRPERAQVDVGRLGPSMTLLQQADQFIQATTATYDPSLGRTNSKERSGKAIAQLQQQGDEGNSHYMHNLAEISMSYEAKVVLDLIPAIYDRAGRLARTLNEEGKTETVMLNAPYVKHPETGRPVPAPNGQVPQGLPQMPMPPAQPGGPPPMQPAPPEVRHYDLKKGIYSVAVSIGKTRQSALQEGAEEIGQILQAMPNLGPIVLPTYLEYRFFPGSKQLAEDLRKVRDRQFPFLAGEDNGAPSPDQMQAQLQAQQQQIQMMGAQLQGAMKAIETEQVKQGATLQKAQMDNETKIRIAEQDNQTKIVIADLNASLEQIKGLLGQKHEKDMQAADQVHDATMSALGTAPMGVPEFKAPDPVPLEIPKEV